MRQFGVDPSRKGADIDALPRCTGQGGRAGSNIFIVATTGLQQVTYINSKGGLVMGLATSRILHAANKVSTRMPMIITIPRNIRIEHWI